MLLSFFESCFFIVIRFYVFNYNENKRFLIIGIEVKWYFVKIGFLLFLNYNNRFKSDILKVYFIVYI